MGVGWGRRCADGQSARCRRARLPAVRGGGRVSQWPHARPAALGVRRLPALVRGDDLDAAPPLESPARRGGAGAAGRPAARQLAGGRGCDRAQVRDHRSLAAIGGRARRGADGGARPRPPPDRGGGGRVLVVRAAEGGAPQAGRPAAEAGGERWGCLSQDRPSRFVVAWAAGPRAAALAEAVVRATRERTADRAGVGWVSDGWAPYPAAVDGIYRDPVPAGPPGWAVLEPTAGVALTRAIKHRRGRRAGRVGGGGGHRPAGGAAHRGHNQRAERGAPGWAG